MRSGQRSECVGVGVGGCGDFVVEELLVKHSLVCFLLFSCTSSGVYQQFQVPLGGLIDREGYEKGCV